MADRELESEPTVESRGPNGWGESLIYAERVNGPTLEAVCEVIRDREGLKPPFREMWHHFKVGAVEFRVRWAPKRREVVDRCGTPDIQAAVAEAASKGVMSPDDVRKRAEDAREKMRREFEEAMRGAEMGRVTMLPDRLGLRDRFAMAALPAYIELVQRTGYNLNADGCFAKVAEHCYRVADEMLRVRSEVAAAPTGKPPKAENGGRIRRVHWRWPGGAEWHEITMFQVPVEVRDCLRDEFSGCLVDDSGREFRFEWVVPDQAG